MEHYEAARKAFAKFINASPDEVAIVTSASAGINSIASALSFKDRNKVVMGEFEFPTMGHVWLAQRIRGAEVQFVPAVGDRIPAANYEKMIDRHTAIVPLTHVCFKNGFRSDVNAVTQIAHAAGALVMLDDYQDCGTRPVDVKAMDLDFYVTGTLKYLLGPPGLAFMYVRKKLISSLTPTVTGWFAQTNPFAYDPQTYRSFSNRSKIRVRLALRAQCLRRHAGNSTAAGNRYGERRDPHTEAYAVVVEFGARSRNPGQDAGR